MSRPPRLCSCGEIVLAGVRCQCQIVTDRARKARFDKKRPSARARGYNVDWQKARAEFLAIHPICTRCDNPATIVHHSVPHRGDPKLFWKKSGWLPVCQPCHDGWYQRQERKL